MKETKIAKIHRWFKFGIRLLIPLLITGAVIVLAIGLIKQI